MVYEKHKTAHEVSGNASIWDRKVSSSILTCGCLSSYALFVVYAYKMCACRSVCCDWLKKA